MIGDLGAYKVGDVGRTCRARLVLETFVVCFYFLIVDLDFDLGGEGDIKA